MRISDWSSDVCSSDLVGLHLFDNRLHVIASAEYYDRKGVLPTADRGWSQGHYLPLTNPDVSASNPASPSNPNFIIAPGATIANQTPGGLIASGPLAGTRSEEHTSELQSLMRNSYAVFCLKQKKTKHQNYN